MGIMLILMLIVLAIRPTLQIAMYGSYPVYAKSGRVMIDDDGICLLKNNGNNYNLTKSNRIPLMFGLIEYECGNKTGNIFSSIECQSCGLYCEANEYIPGCSQKKVIIILGIISGCFVYLCFILSIFLFCKKRTLNLIDLFINSLIYIYVKCSDMMRFREVKKVAKITNNDVNLKFNENICDGKFYDKTQKRRNKMFNKITGKTYANDSVPPYELNIYNSNSAITDNLNQIESPNMGTQINMHKDDDGENVNGEVKDEYNGFYPIINGIRNSNGTFLIITIVITLFGQCLSCDSTMWLTSKGVLCADFKCEEVISHNFVINQNENICMRTSKNEILEVSVKDFKVVNIYKEIYKTSDYKVEVSSFISCQGSDEYCWNSGCEPDKIHPKLNKTNECELCFIGGGCTGDILSCNLGCFYDGHCVWYTWKLSPNGPKYKIYKKVSSTWEVTIATKLNGVKANKILTSGMPQDKILISGLIIPVTILSPSYISEKFDNNLIKIDNFYYEVEASEMNFPINGKIGDFQVSLDEKTLAYEIDNIKCKTSQCKTVCTAPEPSIRRLLNMVNNGNKDNLKEATNLYNNKGMIGVKKYNKATLSIYIGRLDVKNMLISNSKCKMEVLETFSCEGCNTRSYIILRSIEISVEGSLPLISDCTFDMNIVSCNPNTLQRLYITDDFDNCTITFPTINQTLIATINKKFIGSLDPSRPIYSDTTTSEAIGEMVANKDFWNSIITTFSYSTLLTLGITVIFRSIRLILTIYTIKKASDQPE